MNKTFKIQIMKWAFILLLGIIFFISCHDETKDTNLQKKISSSQIDTTIFIVDTLQLSLGTLDTQEGITIVEEPEHAKLFELPADGEGKRDLIYVPKEDYLGVDSILLITKKTNLGDDSFIKIDSVLFVIRILKNDFHKKLIGKWSVSEVCGGFMGTCYTEAWGVFKVEFGDNMDFTETVKDSIIKKKDYYLIDSLGYQYAVVNDISYVNIKYKRYFKFYGSSLYEPRGYLDYIYLPFINN